jgi:WD40 repeat protein
MTLRMTMTIAIQSNDTTDTAGGVLSPDKTWLAVARPNSHVVDIFKTDGDALRLWTSYYGHREGVYNRQGTITALTWLPGSSSLVSASSTDSVHLWNRQGMHQRTLKARGVVLWDICIVQFQ